MTIIPSSILNTSKLFGHLHILEAVLGSVFYIRADEIVFFLFFSGFASRHGHRCIRNAEELGCVSSVFVVAHGCAAETDLIIFPSQ